MWSHFTEKINWVSPTWKLDFILYLQLIQYTVSTYYIAEPWTVRHNKINNFCLALTNLKIGRSFLFSQLSAERFLKQKRPGRGEDERSGSCLISRWGAEEFLFPSTGRQGPGNHHHIISPGIYPTWKQFWYASPPLCQCFSHIWFLWFPWISDAWEGPLPCMPAGLWALCSHLISANPVSESWAWFPFYPALSLRAFFWTQPSSGREKKYNQDTSISILIGFSVWKFALLETHFFELIH